MYLAPPFITDSENKFKDRSEREHVFFSKPRMSATRVWCVRRVSLAVRGQQRSADRLIRELPSPQGGSCLRRQSLHERGAADALPAVEVTRQLPPKSQHAPRVARGIGQLFVVVVVVVVDLSDVNPS